MVSTTSFVFTKILYISYYDWGSEVLILIIIAYHTPTTSFMRLGKMVNVLQSIIQLSHVQPPHDSPHEHNNPTLEVSSTRLWASTTTVPMCSTLTPTIVMHTRAMNNGVHDDVSYPLHKFSQLLSRED